MVSFEKINDGKYRAVVNIELLKKVDIILNDISLGNIDDFIDVNNENLRKLLLTRYISSYYFKDKNLAYNEQGFSIITVDGLGFKLDISVGRIPTGEKEFKYISGVYYTM